MTGWRKLGLLCAALCLLILALYMAHRSISRDVDLALAAAALPTDTLPVVELPSHHISGENARSWSDTTRATDGGSIRGRLVIATAGGVVELEGRSPRKSLDALNGLIDHDLTAMAVDEHIIALGARSGVISLIERDQVRSLQIEDNRYGAVMDLRWHRSSLYIATTSGTLIQLQGPRAITIPPQIEGGITALAEGPQGLLVAGADGAVHRLAGDRLEVVARVSDGPQRLTALAWHDDGLVVGAPTGLLRHNGQGELEVVRNDLFVTSLLSHQDSLWVGTFDDGVVLLPGAGLASSPRRRDLSGRRVDRLRLIEGRPTAFGPGLTAVLEPGGSPQLIELPRGIASGHVTALAFDEQRQLWVGHFDDGIDVLAASGEVIRHLPEIGSGRENMSSVNALRYDEMTPAMVVATSHGVLEVGETDVQVLNRDDGLIGEAVLSILLDSAGRVFATSQGVSFAPRDGSAIRSIYAFHGLPSNRTYALAQARNRLFVGTLGGLTEIEELQVERVLRAGPEGLQANWCVALASGPEGVYVGTIGGGVDLIVGERVVHLASSDEQFSVNPGALLLLDEVLLVGTLERGMLIWDRTERAWRPWEQPFPGASVTALARDDDDIYLGTNRGLLRLGLGAIAQ